MGDPAGFHHRIQRFTQRLSRPGKVQRCTGTDPHNDIKHTGIKADRGILQHAVARPYGKHPALRRRDITHALMRNHHPFRLTGRAGCVDDVSQMLRRQLQRKFIRIRSRIILP
ncbi:hypothetical protein VA7868_04389 [Vibrio aerogenes CECT 7868]|uniref:Uncharacterized protein n=1 Tax=Vibrio aerogenes CECT 7868 TaxID=1216006 RepID=A0A1M6E6R3_9VIBR|nr:hypothetical protein VA7868_04389 [Vibrio aerogenes CECT 7868]